MENDVVYDNYFYRIGYVLAKYDLGISKDEITAGLNNILEEANYDYINGVINARQMLVITRLIYYFL